MAGAASNGSYVRNRHEVPIKAYWSYRRVGQPLRPLAEPGEVSGKNRGGRLDHASTRLAALGCSVAFTPTSLLAVRVWIRGRLAEFPLPNPCGPFQ